MQQRQVSFSEAIKSGFNKYCCFTGRASRSEYWWWVHFTFSVSLALLLPGLGLGVRRLHDIGRSGWAILLALIPIVGAIILIIWFIKDSDPTPNAYGPVPNLVG